MFREIEDIVETLKNAKIDKKKCSVLIGAGCSVTAGIPTAQGFVKIINEQFPSAYRRAKEKTYPKCMEQLSIAQQRDLIARYVDPAKINWAHIALAQLMKAGYVDRVLTTNFDSLVMRACSLLGLYPATYDLAASQLFEPEMVPEQAVFHLHGQRTGFILINTDEAFEKHAKLLAPVFEDAGRGRVWLVVGYSGENDPVFNHLANVKRFDYHLFWIGYQNDAPATHLRDRLLVDGKSAFYTKGFDADSFFVTLAQKLNCFPPDFISKPFSYVDDLFDKLTTYTFPKTNAPVDAMRYARIFVGEAIEEIQPVQSDVLQGWSNLLAGEYEEVIKLKSKYDKDMHREVRELVAWAHIWRGNTLSEQARTKDEDEADDLFQLAYNEYAEAWKIRRIHDVYNYWGHTIYYKARMKSGAEADKLFQLAYDKYASAIKLKPDAYQVFSNWAVALSDQANTKSGDEAKELFRQAYEKFAEAVYIKSDMHEALRNWGIALANHAKIMSGTEVDNLYQQAYEKFKEAMAASPEKQEVLNDWGLALYEQARRKSGRNADGLFKQAEDKYAEALKIKPENHEVLKNWGLTLHKQARMKSGKRADELFKQAEDKYIDALKIRPTDHEVFRDLGAMFLSWYRIAPDDRKRQLLVQAKEILLEAEELMEGSGSYDLACTYALANEEDECRTWLLKSRDIGNLPDRKRLEEDTDLDSVRDKEWFIQFLEKLE
jgi:tetratricopeptide (TPR) repeat protein